MKQILIFITTCSLLSCTDSLDGLNVDRKNATSAAAEAFFGNAAKELSDRVNGFTTGKLFAQHITEVTYPVASNYQIVNGRTADNLWVGLYRDVLKDLYECEAVIHSTPPVGEAGAIQQANQLAMVEILRVYAYSLLVETFGNVPYSEAMDFDNTVPQYDDGLTIYTDLINRLSAAINSIDVSGAGFGSYDLIYYSDDPATASLAVSRWKKFGNSLKLRMGLRIIDADAVLGRSTAEEAIASGVFVSNEDHALFYYLNAPPNTNPLWTALVQSGRQDFVAAKPLVDLMNELEDPRRPVYFSRKADNTFGGNAPGVISSYDLHSHYGSRFFEPTLLGVLMDYASVEFLLAEAAERGLSGAADAETHYRNGIEASFDFYRVTGVEAYMAQPSVAYATAGGTWKEKIGRQKWIALYNQGFEAWTEYRRLDVPTLVAPPDAIVNEVPSRFTYPIDEQTLNGENYHQAASALGGDLLTTKLFWDVN